MFLIPLTDNVLLNESIFGGPYCARNGLDVATLKIEDVTVGADPEYIINYDIDEDDDEWTMPLLKDLDKGDLILLN